MVKPTSIYTPPQRGYMIAAPWRSSGKTMISVGLAAAASQRLSRVQTFKKGPDYIDPLWLASASGRPCYNLDPYQQDTSELLTTYTSHSALADLSLVEGTMGLHDGLATDGSDSNAAVAALLELPVILVVDCRGMHRTVAALISGIQHFDARVQYAGVILNRVRSSRHAQKIQQALAAHTDMPLLGIVPDSEHVNIQERELGLTPAPDHEAAGAVITSMRELVAENVDIDNLLHNDAISGTKRNPRCTTRRTKSPHRTAVIGIAKDEAFHFYYQDDLDYFRSLGVELVECSPCSGSFPDALDGLWIGGGFPERHIGALSGNTRFLSALRRSIEGGLPVHAECGGLMYLCRSLQMDGVSWPLTGVIEADVTLCTKAVGRGYMQLTSADTDQQLLTAHEFHHSKLTFDRIPEFMYRVTRGHGIDGENDGVKLYNVIASYAHFRHTRKTPWIDGFLSRVNDHNNSPAYQYV